MPASILHLLLKARWKRCSSCLPSRRFNLKRRALIPACYDDRADIFRLWLIFFKRVILTRRVKRNGEDCISLIDVLFEKHKVHSQSCEWGDWRRAWVSESKDKRETRNKERARDDGCKCEQKWESLGFWEEVWGSELADRIVGRGSVKGVNSEMEVLARSVTESEMKAKSIVLRLMVRERESPPVDNNFIP